MIELKINVVVVTVVVNSPFCVCVGCTASACVASPAVPNIVLDPIIVETKVRGGIVVVSTEVMVRGASLV